MWIYNYIRYSTRHLHHSCLIYYTPFQELKLLFQMQEYFDLVTSTEPMFHHLLISYVLQFSVRSPRMAESIELGCAYLFKVLEFVIKY